MIHYHGTPIGGSRTDVVRFLKGRHSLIPFARADDAGAVLEVCQSFVLDNSAFSHWRAGKGDVDVAAYHQWVHTFEGHPGLDWCLIPDKIDGTQEQNEKLVVTWLRMGSNVHSTPVWHMHESLGWLDYLVGNFQTVAIGSSGEWRTPGTSAWWRRMAEAMGTACDSRGRPRARLHGLRMLDPEIFSRLPLTSADSTNAAVNCGSIARFGSYVPPTAAQRAEVIAERIESFNISSAWVVDEGAGAIQEAMFPEETRA